MKTVKAILATTVLLLSSSCSHFLAQEKIDYKKDYYTGENLPEKITAKEIEEKVTRKTTMSGGIYELKLTPLTAPLIKARAIEMASLSHQSEEELQALIDSELKKWATDRTCFEFEYQVLRYPLAGKLSSWKMTLLTDLETVGEGEEAEQEKKAYEASLKWEQEKDLPVYSQVMKGLEKYEKWHHQGIGCTDRPVALKSSFALKAQAPIVSWPYSLQTRIDWPLEKDVIIYDSKNPDDLSKAQKKTVPPTQNFQRYRGW